MKRGNGISRRVAFALTMVFIGGATSAFAHGLKVFAWSEADRIQGYVYFSKSARARNARVELHGSSSDVLLAETRSDEKGEFAFDLPDAGEYEIIADSGDGHRAVFPLSVSAPDGASLPASERAAPPGDSSTAISQAARPLPPDDSPRLRDILGGIGYIVGLMGALFFFLGHRQRRRKDEAAQ